MIFHILAKEDVATEPRRGWVLHQPACAGVCEKAVDSLAKR